MATRNQSQEWTVASFDQEAAAAEAQPTNPSINSEWREATFDDAPAPAPAPQAQPAPQAVSAPQVAPQEVAPQTPEQRLTPWDTNMGNYKEVLTETDRTLPQNPEVSVLATDLWRRGIRDPDEYNEVLNSFFPEYEASGNPINITKQTLAGTREYEDAMAATGRTPDLLFGEEIQVPTTKADTETTGIEAIDVGIDAIMRGSKNAVNSIVFGGGALGSELVGAEETADALIDLYSKHQAQINYSYRDAMKTEDVDSLGDAGLFAIDVIGELAPQMASSMGAGVVGTKAATHFLRRGAQDFVETKVANGVSREAAEKLFVESLRRRATQGAIVGTGAITTAQEGGATFGNTALSTGEKAPIMSLAAGLASGALESIIPLKTLGRLNAPDLTGRLNRRFIERAAREGTKDFFIEGATEVAQEFIQSLPEAVITGESPFTDEMFDNMFDVFIRGGVGGATMGVGATAFEGAGTQRAEARENRLITVGKPPEKTEQPEATQAEEPAGTPTRELEGGFTEETIPDFLRNPVVREPAEDTGSGLKVKTVVDTVNAVAQDWTNPPEMTVVNNIDDLDAAVSQAITADGAEDALGVYMPDGSVVFFADNMKDESEIIPVLFHEVLGHSGLNQEFGTELGSMLDNLAETNAKFAGMVDEYMGQRGETDFYIAAEEVLAEVSETEGIFTNDGVINTIKDFIVKWAKRLGINTERMDARQIRSILASAHKRIREGEKQSVSIPGVRYIRTWTVSPSKYIAADNTFMGTGEGAQVYGRGQYAGTSDDTRRNYIRQFKAEAKRRADEAKGMNYVGQSDAAIVSAYEQGELLGTYKRRSHINPNTGNVYDISNAYLESDKPYNLRELVNEGKFNDLDVNAVLRLEGIGRKAIQEDIFSPKEREEINSAFSLIDTVEGRIQKGRQLFGDILHQMEVEAQKEYLALEDAGGKPSEISKLRIKSDLLRSMQRFDAFTTQEKLNQEVDPSAYVYENEYPDEGWMMWQEPLTQQDVEVEEAMKPLFIEMLAKAEDDYRKYKDDSITPPPLLRTPLEIREMQDKFKQLDSDYDKIEEVLANDIDEDADPALYQLYEQDLEDIAEQMEEMAEDAERVFTYEQLAASFTAGDAYNSIVRELMAPGAEEGSFEWAAGQQKLNSIIHPKGVTGIATRDGQTQSNHWGDLETIANSKQKEIDRLEKAFNFDAAQLEFAIDNKEQQIALGGSDIRLLQKDLDNLIADARNLILRRKEELQSVEDLYSMTYNYVLFDPTEGKIVNRFRLDDGEVPAVDQFTDLTQDSTYVDENVDDVMQYTDEQNARPSEFRYSRKPATLTPRHKDRGLAGNVNLNRIATKRGQGVYDSLIDVAEEAPEIASMSFEQIDAMARAKNLGLDDIINMDTGLAAEDAHAVGIALVAKAEKLDRLARLYDTEEGPTAAQEATFAETYLEMSAIYEKYSEMANNAGRLLASFRMVKQTSGLDGIRFRREDLSGIGVPSLSEVARDINKNRDNIGEQIKKRSSTMQELASYLGIPRAIMSSMDFSAPFRQGFFLATTPEFWKTFPRMFTYVGVDGAYDAMIDDLQERATYRLMLSSNLALTTAGGSNLGMKEEMFPSEKAENIPILGRGIKASERVFSGFLTKLRADAFDSMVKDMVATGELPTDLISNLQTINSMPTKTKEDKSKVSKAYSNLMKSLSEDNRKVLSETASFVNAASGRGDIPFSAGKAASPMLNAAFFSPKLIMSRVTMLNPFYYAALPGPVRKRALRNLVRTGALVTTIVNLALMAGLDIEDDPRSSDFGKIRVGTVRYDWLGGSGQYATLAARLIMNETKTTKGEIKKYNEGFGSDSATDAIWRFAQNKTSPVTSYFLDSIRRENVVGDPFQVHTAIGERITPLFLADFAEIMAEQSFDENGDLTAAGILKGGAMSLPVMLGVGRQNFDSVPSDSMLLIHNNPDSPVVQELTRLEDAVGKKPITDAGSRIKVLGEGTEQRQLTPAEYKRYTELIEMYVLNDLSYMLDGAEYREASEADKLEMVRDQLNKARKDARADVSYEIVNNEIEGGSPAQQPAETEQPQQEWTPM